MASMFFLSSHFIGGQFEEHQMPLEVLKDLAVLKDIVLKIAANRFYQRNPDRKRLPKGFGSNIHLSLASLKEGSVIANICLVGGFFLPPNLEEARDVFFQTLSIAETQETNSADQNSFDPAVTPDVLDLIANLGQHLEDGDRIVFNENQASYTFESQNRFRKLAKLEYRREFHTYCTVYEYDKSKHTAKMLTLSGERFGFKVPEAIRECVLTAFNGSPDVRAEVTGDCYYDANGGAKFNLKLNTFDIVDPLDTSLRIEEIRQLKAGWLGEGHGLPFADEELNWLDSFMASRICVKVRPPYLYPIEGENISAEWDTAAAEIILELDLTCRSALLRRYARDPWSTAEEYTFNLHEEEECCRLVAFLEESLNA